MDVGGDRLHQTYELAVVKKEFNSYNLRLIIFRKFYIYSGKLKSISFRNPSVQIAIQSVAQNSL